uniref:NADH-ubiquinone oxidoreductase chain 4 n=1 Tax=Bromius obscurus TaxID=216246 RepID=A0A343C2A8_9CUCU|nr:NADH dehydrogenase subunit 4 [Bromius obscurus]
MMSFILSFLFMIPVLFKISFWFYHNFMLLIMLFFLVGFNYSFMGNISLIFGFDSLSYFLLLLSFWICVLMLIASYKLYKNNNYFHLFIVVNHFLLMSLYLTFSSMNLFSFYFFFEVSLIPTFILIIGWGYQPERIEAGIYLLFYTMFFSLPMMISIFYLYSMIDSLMIMNLPFFNNMILYFCMNMIFMVKVPMFFIHLWLPKAHVEAPVSGSMILAGVLLKLGGYGMIRLMKIFMPIWFWINFYYIIISLVGSFFVSMICLRQSDIKSLIAYSSVSHMGLAMSGILTLNIFGISGSFILMLAHGLCSSGLFCLANLNYERLLSRSLYLNKGMMMVLPNLSFWWFIFCIMNMAAPPSMNLLGEIFLINSLVSYNINLMIFLGLASFLSAAYSLYLFSYIQHGLIYSSIFSFHLGFIREYILLFLHFFPLIFLVVKSDL